MAYRGRAHGSEFETGDRRKRRVGELLANILKGFDLARKSPQLSLSVRDARSNPDFVITKPVNNDDSEDTTVSSSRPKIYPLRLCDDIIENGARLSTKPRSNSMENNKKVVPISPESTPKSLSAPSSPSTQYWFRDLMVEEQILKELGAPDAPDANETYMHKSEKSSAENFKNKNKIGLGLETGRGSDIKNISGSPKTHPHTVHHSYEKFDHIIQNGKTCKKSEPSQYINSSIPYKKIQAKNEIPSIDSSPTGSPTMKEKNIMIHSYLCPNTHPTSAEMKNRNEKKKIKSNEKLNEKVHTATFFTKDSMGDLKMQKQKDSSIPSISSRTESSVDKFSECTSTSTSTSITLSSKLNFPKIPELKNSKIRENKIEITNKKSLVTQDLENFYEFRFCI